MFTVESKSQLAKLLASENLRVEHKQIQTAYFDLKTRTLACPIWKDMSGDLYDLLMGHEVGHALFTPAEGWHDAICNEGKNFKGFLNVIEDARIEKKIKRKYPGIKRSFVNAYKDLIDRDFFGINDRDTQILPFIDKVNLYTKTEGLISFEFSSEEQTMVDRVLACETWKDVVACAKEIFEYSKDEQKSLLEDYFQEPIFDDEDGDSEENDFSDSFDGSGDESDSEFESNDSTKGEDLNSDDQETSSDSGEESDDQSDEESGDEKLSDQTIGSGSDDDFEPRCETDEMFRNSENSLLDETSKNYHYINIPSPNLEQIVTPYKVVHGVLSDYFNRYSSHVDMDYLLKDFRDKNEKYISLMVKEFEMKKSARAYLKNKTSDTGDIDVNKIYKYQIDDNIFKKVTVNSKGKSHGLVLLLDRSGSMTNNMQASIEQILILSMFCKKVNIPFVVYGFTDNTAARRADFRDSKLDFQFEPGNNNLILSEVYLREYLNSTMSKSEFNRCVKNMLYIGKVIEKYPHRLPINESMGGTPLISAMVTLKHITKKFKKDNNLDIVNTVIVHDGDSDIIRSYTVNDTNLDRLLPKSFSVSRDNVFFVDKSEKIQMKLESDPHPIYSYYDYSVKNTIFEWYSKSTDSKIFGFFILGQGRRAKKNLLMTYRDENQKTLMSQKYSKYGSYSISDGDEMYKILRENKFVQSFNKGYSCYYLIPGGKELSVGNEQLEIKGDVTKGKLKTAFLKMGKKKQTNRVLASKFIAGIA